VATSLVEDGVLTDPKDVVSVWKKRIGQAREDRKRYEPTWLSNLAYASGKHFLEWDRFARQLVMPPDLEDKDLFGADIITEQRAAALGRTAIGRRPAGVAARAGW
jgi:hypothetical protein